MRSLPLILTLASFLCTTGCADDLSALAPTDAAHLDGPVDGPIDAARPPAFRIEKRGALAVATYGEDGAEAFSGPDFSVVLDQTLSALPPHRTEAETIVIRGVFVMTATVRLPS